MLGALQMDLEVALRQDSFNKCTKEGLEQVVSYLDDQSVVILRQTSRMLRDRLANSIAHRKQTKVNTSLEMITKKKQAYLYQKGIKIQELQGGKTLIKLQYYDLPEYILKRGLFKQDQKGISMDGVPVKVDLNIQMVFTMGKTVLVMNRSLLDDRLFINRQIQEEQAHLKYEEFYSNYNESEVTDMQSILSRQKKLLMKIEQNKGIHEQDPLLSLSQQQQVTMIICYGGHFSMGVFRRGILIYNKSDHRYVCRKKQGQRQLNKDKSQAAQSIGSQIRRENENKHQESIKDILMNSHDHLDQSTTIFIQAPGINKLMLLQQNTILQRNESKLKSMAITSKKACFSEMESVYKRVCRAMIIQK